MHCWGNFKGCSSALFSLCGHANLCLVRSLSLGQQHTHTHSMAGGTLSLFPLWVLWFQCVQQWCDCCDCCATISVLLSIWEHTAGTGASSRATNHSWQVVGGLFFLPAQTCLCFSLHSGAGSSQCGPTKPPLAAGVPGPQWTQMQTCSRNVQPSAALADVTARGFGTQAH